MRLFGVSLYKILHEFGEGLLIIWREAVLVVAEYLCQHRRPAHHGVVTAMRHLYDCRREGVGAFVTLLIGNQKPLLIFGD